MSRFWKKLRFRITSGQVPLMRIKKIREARKRVGEDIWLMNTCPWAPAHRAGFISREWVTPW